MQQQTIKIKIARKTFLYQEERENMKDVNRVSGCVAQLLRRPKPNKYFEEEYRKSFFKVKNYYFSFFKREQRVTLLVITIILQTKYLFKTSMSLSFVATLLGATLQWGDTTYIR